MILYCCWVSTFKQRLLLFRFRHLQSHSTQWWPIRHFTISLLDFQPLCYSIFSKHPNYWSAFLSNATRNLVFSLFIFSLSLVKVFFAFPTQIDVPESLFTPFKTIDLWLIRLISAVLIPFSFFLQLLQPLLFIFALKAMPQPSAFCSYAKCERKLFESAQVSIFSTAPKSFRSRTSFAQKPFFVAAPWNFSYSSNPSNTFALRLHTHSFLFYWVVSISSSKWNAWNYFTASYKLF